MARRTGKSRVAGSGGHSGEPHVEDELPSLRKRRPVMFWGVMIAVAALLLAYIATFVSAFA